MEKEGQLGQWANRPTPLAGSEALELQEGQRAGSREVSLSHWLDLGDSQLGGEGPPEHLPVQVPLRPCSGSEHGGWNLTILEPHLPSLDLDHLPEPQFPQL